MCLYVETINVEKIVFEIVFFYFIIEFLEVVLLASVGAQKNERSLIAFVCVFG